MIRFVVGGAALTLAALSVQAQTQAPGLWEHTIKMKSTDGKAEAAMEQMRKQIEAMPPEKRQQMEAAMRSSGLALGAGGTTMKVCVTKEEAERPPEARLARSDCTHKDVQRSGNTMKFKFECAKPPSSGEGEMTFISDKAYAGKSLVTSTAAGKTQQMTMEMSGKWLASDCGDVKPRRATGAASAAK